MDVIIIPVLNDNYAYLLIDTTKGEAAAIDPSDAHAVYTKANELGVQITHILNTHSHWDHTAGNISLHKLIKDEQQVDVPICGSINDPVSGQTYDIHDQDVIQIGNLDVHVLATPCHTPGHVLFLCNNALFTGDTLFIAGCGRFNQGTPEQMYHNMYNVIAKLPPNTSIYCGHEYTTSNLRFAAQVEPQNSAISNKLAWASQQDNEKIPTVPSTLAEELETNPFLRVHIPEVQHFVSSELDDHIEIMKKLRQAKNKFGLGRSAKH